MVDAFMALLLLRSPNGGSSMPFPEDGRHRLLTEAQTEDLGQRADAADAAGAYLDAGRLFGAFLPACRPAWSDHRGTSSSSPPSSNG
jgi:hypothetical protein